MKRSKRGADWPGWQALFASERLPFHALLPNNSMTTKGSLCHGIVEKKTLIRKSDS
jgi:hypothetical protein